MFPEGRALEFLIAATVALIVVGPKDLPVLLRKLGQFMAKVRSMAAEFRASFDEMARQSELDELRKEVETMRKGQMADIASSAPHAEMAQTFDEINQGLTDVGVQLHPPMSYQYAAAEVATEVQPIVKAPRTRKTTAKAAATKKTPAKSPAPKTKAAAPKAVAKVPAAKAPAAKVPAAKARSAPARPRTRKTAGTAS